MAVKKSKSKSAKKPKVSTDTGDLQPTVQHVEPIREIYIDGIVGGMVKDGVVRLNLFEDIQNFAEDALVRRVVARLVMPVSLVSGMHTMFGDMLRQMESAQMDDSGKN